MAPDISEVDEIPSLDDGGIPFEAPPGRVAPPERVAPQRARKRKKKRGSLIGFLAIAYALGALGIGAIDHGGLYLFAWLVTGPVLYAAARKFRPRR